MAGIATNTPATTDPAPREVDEDPDRDRIQSLLEYRSPIKKDTKLRTMLAQVCYKGRLDLVKLLLHHHVRVDPRSYELRQAFKHACRNSMVEMVELLIQHGGGKALWFKSMTPVLLDLCRTGNYTMAKILVDHGVCLDKQDNYKKSPLLYACINNHYSIVELLVHHGAKLNLQDHTGKTALIFSSKAGFVKIIDLLLTSGASTDERDANGRTALMEACLNAQLDSVVSLLKHGADVNASDRRGKTALMYLEIWVDKEYDLRADLDLDEQTPVATEGELSSINERVKKMKDIMVLLIQHGADINACDVNQKSVFMYTCQNGHEEMVDILIQKGVDVNAQDCSDRTPLMYACWWWPLQHPAGNRRSQVLELLLRHGANFESKDKDGHTALMCCCGHKLPNLVEILIDNGAKIDEVNNEGYSALMVAVMNDGPKSVKSLLKAKASVDIIVNYRDKPVTVFYLAMDVFQNNALNHLLEDGRLLSNGRLKPIHTMFVTDDDCSSLFQINTLLILVEYGLIEWKWCIEFNFTEPLKLFSAALDRGLCPGLMKKKVYFRAGTFSWKKLWISPLILSFLEDDSDMINKCLDRLYYFPEDYRTLSTDEMMRAEITNTDLLDKLTLQTHSLFTWSFITVSKAISLSGSPGERSQRVDSLPIPVSMKNRLMFKMDKEA